MSLPATSRVPRTAPERHQSRRIAWANCVGEAAQRTGLPLTSYARDVVGIQPEGLLDGRHRHRDSL